MNALTHMKDYVSSVKDVLGFLKQTQSMWLAPLVFVLLLLATLAFFLEGSVLAPAIYSIF